MLKKEWEKIKLEVGYKKYACPVYNKEYKV